MLPENIISKSLKRRQPRWKRRSEGRQNRIECGVEKRKERAKGRLIRTYVWIHLYNRKKPKKRKKARIDPILKARVYDEALHFWERYAALDVEHHNNRIVPEVLRRRVIKTIPFHRPRSQPRARTPLNLNAPSNGPPEDEEDDESGDDDGEDDPAPPIAPSPKRRRGRPRKSRRFRSLAKPATYKRRREKLDAVAEALAGRGEAIFATLVPPVPPSEEARRLAAVPPEVGQAFSALAGRLRREGVAFALVVETRAGDGAFYPHAHLITEGLPIARLRTLARRSGLELRHAEELQNPKAAARYLAKAGQRRHYDALLGARGFWASTGREGRSPKRFPGKQPALPQGPIPLAPGVVVVDPPRFLAANLRGLESPSPVVRQAARDALESFCQAVDLPPPPDLRRLSALLGVDHDRAALCPGPGLW
ncbi:hypothetical protein A0O31_01932 [Thermus brockianus]|uniref:Replication protein n=1 Tax=Thermus brockianus TaxID=56956 RepID=A0A1J0LX27_THEBO|nr:hypothetical protein A0O31_01932 [Thermus brockianus]